MKNVNGLSLLFVILIIIPKILFAERAIEVNSDFINWKKKHEEELYKIISFQQKILDPHFTFKSLELVVVDPGEKYFSRWGHLMILMKGTHVENPHQDFALSFLADFNDFPVSDLKASFGGYVVQARINSIESYELDYTQKEGRKMNFYPLSSTKEQNERFLTILRSWIRRPDLPGGYSFFYNNCVSLLVKILKESGIIKEWGLYGYWPKYVALHFQKEGLIK
jgi:hypothetical protein